MTTGERIKEARERLGLSQDELAKKMGYSSKSAVSRTENAGDRIDQRRIKKFSEALGVSIPYLMGWEDFEMNPETHTWEVKEHSKPDYIEGSGELSELIEVCKGMSPEHCKVLISMAKALKGKDVE